MKFNFSNTPLGRFRLVAFLEGISFLLLLLVAMPLKYFAGIPEVVKFVGWAHGLLFILYMVLLIQVAISLRWGLLRVFLAFIASLLPFGTMVLDVQLRKEEKMLLEKQ